MSSQPASAASDTALTYRGLHGMGQWWEDAERFEARCVPIFRPFIRPGDLVFDIGANRGQKTWIFRHLGARVIAVDPLFAFGSEFVPEFGWRFGGDAGVTLVARAVSNRHVVRISINRFIPEYSSIDKRWMFESAHSVKAGQPYFIPTSLITRDVQGVTLDALIDVYGLPRFIKIDVEGAEDDAVATLSQPVSALNMEFHADWIPVAAIERMDSMGGYQWNYALGDAGEFVMPEWVCRGKLLDYLRSHLTKEGDGSWGDIYGRLS